MGVASGAAISSAAPRVEVPVGVAVASVSLEINRNGAALDGKLLAGALGAAASDGLVSDAAVELSDPVPLDENAVAGGAALEDEAASEGDGEPLTLSPEIVAFCEAVCIADEFKAPSDDPFGLCDELGAGVDVPTDPVLAHVADAERLESPVVGLPASLHVMLKEPPELELALLAAVGAVFELLGVELVVVADTARALAVVES